MFMTQSIIVSILSLLGTAVGAFGGFRLTAYRIEQLEKKVDAYNQVKDRMLLAERDIQAAFKRIDEMRNEIHAHHPIKD